MKAMCRFLVLVLLSFLYMGSYAQFSKIIVFAPKGEKFNLYISGTSQNGDPESRVEADVPGGPSFKIKVIFSDPSIKEINKLVFNKPNNTFYFKVDKNAKGVYVLESTSSEWSDAAPTKEVKSVPPKEKAGAEIKTATVEKGCAGPMDESSFLASLVSVSAPPFDPPKLSAAKKLANEHCLSVSQVKQVMYVFSNESTRLNFAKFAYDHTFNKKDYSEVSEVLNTERSRTDLEKFIAGKK